MCKLILADYFSMRHAAFRKVVEKGGWFIYLYLLFLGPFWSRRMIKNVWIYLVEMIVLAISLLISRMYPNRLAKNMYLCPLSRTERKNYLDTAYLLRNGVGIALFLCANIVLLVTGTVTWSDVGSLSFIFLFFTITSNYYVIDTGKSPYIKEKQLIKTNPGFRGYSGCMLTAQILGLFNYLLVVSTIGVDDSWDDWELVILAILMAAQVLMYLIIRLRYRRQVMEIGIDYENCY